MRRPLNMEGARASTSYRGDAPGAARPRRGRFASSCRPQSDSTWPPRPHNQGGHVPRSRPLLLMCSLPAVLLAGSRSTAADPDAAAAIVSAERAFAAQVRSAGVRDGFLAWLSPTSVVFRPGPVNGIKTYEKSKPGWNGLLAWTPTHAAISADGKLGWSTGPWTFSRDSTQKKPDAHGDYMSVWRLQTDGSWKAVLDCGVGHPAPARDTPAVTFSAPVAGASLGSRP